MKKYWQLFTDKFGNTILHPQFIMLSYTKEAEKEIAKNARDKDLIDIGCGRMPYRKSLESKVKSYVGVDHPKISELYTSDIKPDVFCDITKKIPLKDSSFDLAIMLEVLEYLENPKKTFSEIYRLLRPNGILIFTVPFLYPLHDMPYDRNRYTNTQIKTFLLKSNFEILKLKVQGNFLSFWFQSINVFLFKRIMDIVKQEKNPLSIIYLLILLILTPIVVLSTNILFLVARNFEILKYPDYFPLNYLVVGVKESKN